MQMCRMHGRMLHAGVDQGLGAQQLTSKPSGGCVTAGTTASGSFAPGQTQTKPSASQTGREETAMPLQKAVEGMRVQTPLPSYSQP